ncbi:MULTISPECIES: HPP family protein [unclassified Pseudomonas]|uniref:HPP family protein n=1 Tax=unclassified Pseudomonas TaxID=196821 RepID=UPI000BC7A80F|nr:MULTISPECIES: HPP family protein [unclassified Pseudomonas]PVZ19655.1 CBS domain-containing membrane protein [Pseudomonas sp. URIL14HWK12:I12]PVZ22760.1 CBS domain-containing membrane protein [Pseudomonas sp. URIL14HWK12:I10]PVZ37610.1 CBS domain-containing membrane protein [Pseudomonas sp. URIL14HWK12:I11]SNZ15245.1 CBS domain-containing membrane protein [Pseudomonas sp. URIL14HWK12:I9]
MPHTPDSLAWLKALLPAPLTITPKEKLRASIGAALGILLAALGAAWWSQGLAAHTSPLLALVLVAPLGASAVLVFALPSSPLAQPWSVIGGNTLSALVGIACSRWIPDATLAAALAVGVAIVVMMALRCLHPPGGAAALLMVLAGASDFGIALHPVLLDSVLMVVAGLLYNNLTRHRWPHRQRPPSAEARLQQSDLDAALARYNQVLDISRDDLQALLEQAEAAAYQRTMGVLRCQDVMTPDPVVARTDTALQAAWALMRKHRVKALPVVDSQWHLVGIVTVADFMRQVDMDVHEGVAWRLRSLLRPKAPGGDSQVGQIMTRNVRVASSDRLLMDLVPVFSVAGHRHIPIIDAKRRLVGIITQSDLIKALFKAVHG